MLSQASLRDAQHRAKKLSQILTEPSYRRALFRGIPAATEHDNVPYPTDFRTVVDVGANRGQFALVAMRRFPHATLWCFEPLPDARAKLEVILGSCAKAKVLDYALSARAGHEVMHVTRSDDSSSLRPVGERQLAEFPGTDEIRSMQVRTARLDEVLTREQIVSPALLKVDVQGSELDVLLGANGVLKAFDAILVECSFVELYLDQPLASDIIAFLAPLGWRLSGAYSVTYGSAGSCLQADLLFQRGVTHDPDSDNASTQDAPVEISTGDPMS